MAHAFTDPSALAHAHAIDLIDPLASAQEFNPTFDQFDTSTSSNTFDPSSTANAFDESAKSKASAHSDPPYLLTADDGLTSLAHSDDDDAYDDSRIDFQVRQFILFIFSIFDLFSNKFIYPWKVSFLDLVFVNVVFYIGCSSTVNTSFATSFST